MQWGKPAPAEQGEIGRIESICLEVNGNFRRLSAAILGVWAAGTLSAGVLNLDRDNSAEPLEATACVEAEMLCSEQALADDASAEAAVSTDTSAVETTTSTSLPPETTTTAEPAPTTTISSPPPEIIVEAAARAMEYRTPLDTSTMEALNGMELTAEGYEKFFETIDMSWFDYAQSYSNFNPSRVPIAQNPTEWVTAHFTASYSNSDGPSPEPVGEMDVKRLIDFMANRGNPCCGVNFFIDRDGRAIQVAPYQAKLRHNPPYDDKTVGFEMEAAFQHQLTSAQLDTASYITIASLQLDGLLDPATLQQRFHGHGEDRDNFRDNHPDSKWDERNDCDAPIMDAWRQKMLEFIQKNPDIAQLTQQLR